MNPCWQIGGINCSSTGFGNTRVLVHLLYLQLDLMPGKNVWASYVPRGALTLTHVAHELALASSTCNIVFDCIRRLCSEFRWICQRKYPHVFAHAELSSDNGSSAVISHFFERQVTLVAVSYYSHVEIPDHFKAGRGTAKSLSRKAEPIMHACHL